jgi:hypothetical protein
MVGLAVSESDRLRHLLDVTVEAYALETRGQPPRGRTKSLREEQDEAAFDAAETLNELIDPLVDDVIAEACVDVISNVDNHREHRPDQAVQKAVDEAHSWLEARPEVVARNDLTVPQRPTIV